MYQLDSRKIQPGDVFICLPNAESFVPDALARGASEVKLFSDRLALAKWAHNHFGFPAKSLSVVGVTGTNGKTTVTHLIAQALNKNGHNAFVLGTLSSDMTTPEIVYVLNLMKSHLDSGGTHFVMEVSSHAIDQGRHWGISFDVKVLTNLAQDHLDYHKTLEAYHQTKLGFLSETDPVTGESLADTAQITPERYGKESVFFQHPLKGQFNHENMQAAIAACRVLGLTDAQIESGLTDAEAPVGRFEQFNEGQPFMAIVDFAHTEDGLENVLAEARSIADGHQARVISVFGCGGDRDRDKRPKMVKAGAKYSDFMVLTQDNPRNESFDQIMDDMIQGVPDGYTQYEIEHDRKAAIHKSLRYAKDNDVVVIAGRGHEEFQIIKDEKRVLNDRDVTRAFLKEHWS